MSRETALVTGASAGIGLELAQVYASEGFDLVLVARRADRLEALAGRLRAEHGARVTVLPTDLLADGAAQGLYEQVAATGIRVDVLVNNAGVLDVPRDRARDAPAADPAERRDAHRADAPLPGSSAAARSSFP